MFYIVAYASLQRDLLGSGPPGARHVISNCIPFTPIGPVMHNSVSSNLGIGISRLIGRERLPKSSIPSCGAPAYWAITSPLKSRKNLGLEATPEKQTEQQLVVRPAADMLPESGELGEQVE